MQILFSARPAFGHVYPLLPLADAARRDGHDVRFATTGRFLSTLDRLGYPTYDVGIGIEEAVATMVAASASDSFPTRSDGRPDLDGGARLFVDLLARPTVDDLLPLLDRLDPDLVIYEQGELGAPVAAHLRGVPAVAHALSPWTSAEAFGGSAAHLVQLLWADHGVDVAPVDVFTGDVYLDIIPDILQPPTFLDHPARVLIQPVPVSMPGAAAPPWLGHSGRPLIYLTLGTVVATDDVLRPALDGLASLDVDVLVALGSASGAELGALPGNVHVETFVDQPAVLRHAALAVHHGGTGTVLGAISAGTPQVLLPKGADQFINADLLRAADLAVVLEPGEATPPAIAAAAADAMGRPWPAVDTVRDELAAMPAPAVVLRQLVARFDPRAESAA